MADSASGQSSMPISSSLRTRRSTRTTFSSAQKTSACKLIRRLEIGPAWRFASTPGRGPFRFLTLIVQQVSHAAELFCSRLQCFDLLAQLSLLRLFLTQHLVDVPHSFGLLIAL